MMTNFVHCVKRDIICLDALEIYKRWRLGSKLKPGKEGSVHDHSCCFSLGGHLGEDQQPGGGRWLRKGRWLWGSMVVMRKGLTDNLFGCRALVHYVPIV